MYKIKNTPQRRFRSGFTFQGRRREEAFRIITPGMLVSTMLVALMLVMTMLVVMLVVVMMVTMMMVTMAKHLDTITICSSQPGVEETPKALSNGSAKGDSAEVRGGFKRHYHPHLEPQHHQQQHPVATKIAL